ncbi:LolA family protein [Sphingobacterium sp. LRF_L2]|uniref:LolA family protein n=1 Tax=Sphingobacterium sp. LRF_L2 TaxID=3369421 RepID=UPI003F5FAD4F
MKATLTIVMLLLFGNFAVSFAQTDPAAKKLLDEVSKKYDAYNTIQASFTFSAKQGETGDYADSGTIFLNKQKNQYRIILRVQELISDGKTTWSILKEDKEIQVSDAENNVETIGPNNLFTFYKKGYKYLTTEDEKVGSEMLKVVELSPIDTRTNYFKIKIRINKNKHIHDVLIFDKSGGRYTYTIQSLYVNHKISATNFTFNKSNYPQFEIVDLR